MDSTGVPGFANDDVYAFKFITKPSAAIGAKEVAVEAKEKMIASIQRQINTTTDPLKVAELEQQIANYRSEIGDLYNGTDTVDGLYEQMRDAAELLDQLDTLITQNAVLNAQQTQIEATFSAAMGDYLRDGYWSDPNYTVGQEQSLYNDAVSLLNQISKPTVTYQISTIKLSEAMGFEVEPFD